MCLARCDGVCVVICGWQKLRSGLWVVVVVVMVVGIVWLEYFQVPILVDPRVVFSLSHTTPLLERSHDTF